MFVNIRENLVTFMREPYVLSMCLFLYLKLFFKITYLKYSKLKTKNKNQNAYLVPSSRSFSSSGIFPPGLQCPQNDILVSIFLWNMLTWPPFSIFFFQARDSRSFLLLLISDHKAMVPYLASKCSSTE